ncbi:hypothetical protein MCOR02_006701 [Pyricularia oryzae]|nr:hypothetical protein MCOR02_006701 [Pyricularia oryzae]
MQVWTAPVVRNHIVLDAQECQGTLQTRLNVVNTLKQLSYKLFEPGYHNQRPIIVDEELQSPDHAAHTAAYGPSSPSDSGAGGDVTVLSRHPDSGPVGTRVTLSVSSATDLTASTSYICVSFGSQRCPAQVCKKVENNGGWVFTISAVAPQFLLTQCNSPSDVPLTIFVDANADSMTRVVSGGSFTYLLEGGRMGMWQALAGGAMGRLVTWVSGTRTPLSRAKAKPTWMRRAMPRHLRQAKATIFNNIISNSRPRT